MSPQISGTESNKNKNVALSQGTHSAHKDVKVAWTPMTYKYLSFSMGKVKAEDLGKFSNKNVREIHSREAGQPGTPSHTQHVHFHIVKKTDIVKNQ